MSRYGTIVEQVTNPATGALTDATRGVHQECLYAVVADLTANTTDVTTGPVLLYGIYVNTSVSATHVTSIDDGTTAVIKLPAAAAAGAMYTFPGIRFETKLVCNPDDATTTGSLTFAYRPI
jgi:hypothetical protein